MNDNLNLNKKTDEYDKRKHSHSNSSKESTKSQVTHRDSLVNRNSVQSSISSQIDVTNSDDGADSNTGSSVVPVIATENQSKQKSKKFLNRFKNKIPEDEYVINEFTCALLRNNNRLLIQGCLYVTQSYYAFYSNLFGHETIQYGKWSDVCDIKKETVAFIFPTAIRFYTKYDGNFLFASFLTRNTAYDCMMTLWTKQTQEIESVTKIKSNSVSSYDTISIAAVSPPPLPPPCEHNRNTNKTFIKSDISVKPTAHTSTIQQPIQNVNSLDSNNSNPNQSDITSVLNPININGSDNNNDKSFLIKFKIYFLFILKYFIPVYTTVYNNVEIINNFLILIIFCIIIVVLYLYLFIILMQLNNIEENLSDLYKKLNQ